ncbi:hypothetical protein PM082_023384 [Marasmius tenuissimus]|nr:hypothetical protein PM082_023384 [Marasmius tenuissimus]
MHLNIFDRPLPLIIERIGSNRYNTMLGALARNTEGFIASKLRYEASMAGIKRSGYLITCELSQTMPNADSVHKNCWLFTCCDSENETGNVFFRIFEGRDPSIMVFDWRFVILAIYLCPSAMHFSQSSLISAVPYTTLVDAQVHFRGKDGQFRINTSS